MTILCVVCKTNESMIQKGDGAPLCRPCRAEITLTSPDPKVALAAVDAVFHAEQGKITLNATVESAITGAMARAVKCERCGKIEAYSPVDKKTSFFCDECGKQLCRDCAAACTHKDFNGPKILCTDCRAEKSLTGQPAEETVRDLPETEKKNHHPHCGRATCIGDPQDPDPWCDCACEKCRTAVGSGNPAPMFGKMTPDPDPEPESDKTQTDFDEEEIARWEGGQQ